MKRFAVVAWPAVVAAILFFGTWELFVRVQDIAPLVLPAPSAILESLVKHWHAYLSDAWVTFGEAFWGFFVSLLLSFALAALMVRISVLDRALEPMQTALRCMPVAAISPALALWLGFGALPKVVMAALITFAPFLVNALAGLRSVDKNTHEVFHSVNASNMDVLLKLRVPHAIPYMFSAAKIAVSLALMGAVVAEWSGSSEGLGYTILQAQKNLETTVVWGCIALLVAMGIVLTLLVSALERRVLRWLPQQ